MKKILIAILFFALFVPRNEVSALSCAQPNLEDEIERSEVVFKGTLVEIDNKKFKDDYDFHYNKLLFEVNEVWKGEVFEQISVYDDATWGTTKEVGKEYVVMAFKNSEMLMINVCGLTGSIDLDKKVSKIIKESYLPKKIDKKEIKKEEINKEEVNKEVGKEKYLYILISFVLIVLIALILKKINKYKE